MDDEEMKTLKKLGTKGTRLLNVLVNKIKTGRIRKYDRRSFVPYSEALLILGAPDPELRSGVRLQKEGLSELNEWTKELGLPHIAGLVVSKTTWIPSDGYPESHGFKTGDDWENWWLKQTADSVDFNWSEYL
jgi:hypothetical protein